MSPQAAAPHTPPLPAEAPARAPAPVRRDFASRLFGYDIFISFALGPPPRGSLSYASDLARRLRERDFTVFFSEDEAPPGDELDSTLSRALRGSRALVVIANRGTLQAPRWVRTEVESFRKLTPARVVIPISVGGSLQDPALADQTAEWLPFKDRIWLDETQQAADAGVASPELVERLALAPRRTRSSVKWRWLVRAVGLVLLVLAVGMAIAAYRAHQSELRAVDSDMRARAELQRAVSLRAAAEAPPMVAGDRVGGHERALQQLLAAHALAGGSLEIDSAMQSVVAATTRELKVRDTGTALFAAAFSPLPGASRFATGGSGGLVQQWDAQNLQPLGAPLQGPTADVFSVAYSPDGRRLAAAGMGGRLWLWDANTGTLQATPARADRAAIRGLAFMPDGRHIVTGGTDGALQWWDANTGEVVGPPLPSGADVVSAVAVSPDGQHIVMGGDAGFLSLWSRQGERWAPAGGLDNEPGPWIHGVAFNADGSRIASIDGDGRLRLWDGQSGESVGTVQQGHLKGESSVRFSPDGSLLLTGGGGGSLVAWDAAQGQRQGAWLQGQGRTVTALAFSADGQRAVSGGEDGLLRVWDTQADPAQAPALPEPWERPRGVALSPDGAIKAVGLDRGRLQLLDATRGTPLGDPVEGHQTRAGLRVHVKEPQLKLRALGFSADGKRLASGSQNGTVQLWEAQPLRPVGAPLAGHDGEVTSVAFSPDAAYLVSGGADGTLRFWNTASGKQAGQPVALHGQSVRSLAFSADGGHVIAVDAQKQARWWPAPAAWPATLCNKLTRNMSHRQWNDWVSTEVAYLEPCPGLPVPP